MADEFSRFRKRKNFLVCIDSDGCAMDTTEIRHTRCFGPCLAVEWGLEEWRAEILTRWNEINLYTMTRGGNCFKSLAMILQEIKEKYCDIEDLDTLVQWVQTSPELSEEALEREIEQNDSPCLRKALSWITAVRAAITLLPEEEQRPFEGARRALAQAHRYADIAVLSGDNLSAVLDEWDLYGLLEYTDIVLAQEFGSKTCCIRELIRQGYEPNRVVLCGDAPDDLEAARANGVLYYPILVKHENESWAEFAAEGLTHLLDGSFSGAYQQRKIDEFFRHLGGSS